MHYPDHLSPFPSREQLPTDPARDQLGESALRGAGVEAPLALAGTDSEQVESDGYVIDGRVYHDKEAAAQAARDAIDQIHKEAGTPPIHAQHEQANQAASAAADFLGGQQAA
jgi:hypothetical protein